MHRDERAADHSSLAMPEEEEAANLESMADLVRGLELMEQMLEQRVTRGRRWRCFRFW